MYSLQQPAHRVGQQHPSSNMPIDYDTMLQDVSNHMSKSELLRRLSTHSSSTNGSRRGTARITKQTSASNSPHNVQRRRTTANHTSRAHSRISHDSPYQTREQRLRNYYCPQGSMSSQRPMSWHPGSQDYRSPGTYVSTSEPAIGNTIAGLENLAVSSAAVPSLQQSIQDAFAMGYGYPIGAPTTTYEESSAVMPGYGTLGLASEPANDSYPTYSISDLPQQPPMPQATTYNAYSAATYQLPRQWPQGLDYAVDPQLPQAMPSHVPTQEPVITTRQSKVTPRLARRRSQELVGMGLYDDKASDFRSSLNSAVSENPNRDSLGKGLKLEETWQPPIDEEEDDDEAYSSDEAEEVEEAPPSFITSAPAEVQTSFYPTCNDLSGQSFFFNEDDEYINNDQYANYLTYGQELSEAQPKPQLNHGMENYLWL